MPITFSGCAAPRPADDERAPVAALRGEARVAEHVGHQLGEEFGHRDDAEARLARLERERVAGQRGRDDRERVGRDRRRSAPGSVSSGISSWNSHDRAGPAV